MTFDFPILVGLIARNCRVRCDGRKSQLTKRPSNDGRFSTTNNTTTTTRRRTVLRQSERVRDVVDDVANSISRTLQRARTNTLQSHHHASSFSADRSMLFCFDGDWSVLHRSVVCGLAGPSRRDVGALLFNSFANALCDRDLSTEALPARFATNTRT